MTTEQLQAMSPVSGPSAIIASVMDRELVVVLVILPPSSTMIRSLQAASHHSNRSHSPDIISFSHRPSAANPDPKFQSGPFRPVCAAGWPGEGYTGTGARPQRFPWLQIVELGLLWGAFLTLQLLKSHQDRCQAAYFVLFAVQAVSALAAGAFFTWQVGSLGGFGLIAWWVGEYDMSSSVVAVGTQHRSIQ